MKRQAALLIGLGALILWISSRSRWLTVSVFDDLAGAAVHDLPGSVWSTEATAVALLLAVATIAALALRRLGRRLVGIVAALAAAGASWTPLTLLTGEPDPQRAHALLSSGAASQRASDPVSISSWAQVTSIDVATLGPALALLGCAVALVGGVLLALRPGVDGPKLNKYERKAARREKLEEDLRTSPDSGRVMWDALDDDIDPTDPTDSAR
ncbi:TIGR02234 family membrane protein [Corynebacterium doosanense]|uniref:Membrane protein n=1 Tax=Corynebacterium doosanense CAU 212 = DSM 45436 TaxID=558173 RepID=A0A097IGW8_9CORY|nr:TIGR02234 family membrane protein [Corynebacterium doosanense]AIT61408.1 membrane protein [Corynebacterium doosanense CAU 212 = DSM 45436]